MNRGYKEFEVYKMAHEIGIEIHGLSLKLPKYENYEIGSQIRRASKSISANIVEGYGRHRYHAEYIRFLIFSQASCDEIIEWLEYIRDCYSDLKADADAMLLKSDTLGKKINKFIQAVESRNL